MSGNGRLAAWQAKASLPREFQWTMPASMRLFAARRTTEVPTQSSAPGGSRTKHPQSPEFEEES